MLKPEKSAKTRVALKRTIAISGLADKGARARVRTLGPVEEFQINF
jgi:hypothetical protein